MAGTLIPIRLSHVVSQSGIGAIVRGPHALVIVHDTRQWTDRLDKTAGNEIPYVERVRAALGISQTLRTPPVASELAHSQIEGICLPASRFPSWMRCPRCGALYRRPWLDPSASNPPRCVDKNCNTHPQLEQLSWVLAHPNGYVDDVPWHYLAHFGARNPHQKGCKVEVQLRLIDRGYEDRTLRCIACSAENRFRGDERLGFGQGRMQPWTKDDKVPGGASNDNAQAQVLAINDTRVYAPLTDTALVIPPESRVRKGTVVDLLYRSSGKRAEIDAASTPLAKKSVLRTLATAFRCTVEDIKVALADIKAGYPMYGDNPTPGQLLESEYDAFLERLPDQKDDEDLVTQHLAKDWQNLKAGNGMTPSVSQCIDGVSNLVRIDRLKVIRVFKGFSRLGGGDDGAIVPPDVVGQSDWLPAIELYGEGIFITLNEHRLHAWEQTGGTLARLQALMPRFRQSERDRPNALTARFMLLHTLSHLLARQIESESGYPAASLTERIYCSIAPKPMAGILIHVAVPDIAGSLGGLAELAEPKRFLGALVRALEHAQWCSLDPVCRESQGQGPGLLNRAACHACTLVPEPACDYGNTLLDRCFVKGDAETGLPAFFEMDVS